MTFILKPKRRIGFDTQKVAHLINGMEIFGYVLTGKMKVNSYENKIALVFRQKVIHLEKEFLGQMQEIKGYLLDLLTSLCCMTRGRLVFFPTRIFSMHWLY